MPNQENYEMIAQSYEAGVKKNYGPSRKYGCPALGNENYMKAQAAMHILSDAQERANGDLGSGVNDMVNAAKMLLCDIIDANRAPR